jgi:hypothetical protein
MKLKIIVYILGEIIYFYVFKTLRFGVYISTPDRFRMGPIFPVIINSLYVLGSAKYPIIVSKKNDQYFKQNIRGFFAFLIFDEEVFASEMLQSRNKR